MKSKTPSMKKNILTISLLSLMLIGVVYATRYTQSLPFQSSLEILFNPSGNQTWNWCPSNTETVQLQKDGHKIQSSLQAFCTVRLEPAPEIPQEKYVPLLKAIGPDRTVTLEANAELEVFRVEGLPFKSKALTEVLKARLTEFK